MYYDDKRVEPLRQQHHQEVVTRLQSAMAAEAIDTLVVFRGDYFNWINTHESVFASFMGMSMVVIPPEGPPFGICADHEFEAMTKNGLIEDWCQVRTWTGIEDRYAEERISYANTGQAQFGEHASPFLGVLASELEARGLHEARLGIELPDMKLGLYESLVKTMPKADLVNSVPLLQRACAIKTAYDLYNTRFVTWHQWRVTHDVMMNIKPGDSYADIRKRIELGAAQIPGIQNIKFLMLYMGKTASATLRHFDESIAEGDMISVDLGFCTRGYNADSGRAYVLGEPSAQQARIAEVYGAAHTAVKKAMVPGARLGDLYDMAADMVRAHDVSDFRRGHIGHGLGCGAGVEEWPWTVHGEDVVLKPNMIMTLEIPFYGRGFGAYFEEDVVLITETGNESLTSAPFGLNVIPC